MALALAGLISPLRLSVISKGARSYECGIPTREGMAQFHISYYLYAILFLMFDVRPCFSPWAVNMRALGTGWSALHRCIFQFWCWASYVPGGKELF